MAAGKISIQANDGKVAGVVFEDGASSNVTVTIPKEGGVLATQDTLNNTISVPAAYHIYNGKLELQNSVLTTGFSTTLYTGSGTSQSITTGVDMDTQWGNDISEKFGGLVWVKSRSTAVNYILIDSVRGDNYIGSNTTNAQVSQDITDFTSTGFNIKVGGAGSSTNENLAPYASWNFQTTHRISGTTNHGKAFTCHYNPFTGFTIVKYEGSGLAGHEIPHYLGRKLGVTVYKNLTAVSDWSVVNTFIDGVLYLNTTAAITGSGFLVQLAENTNTLFTASGVAGNASSNTYIMYGWANSYFDEKNTLIGNYEIGVYQGTGAAGNKVTTRGKPAWVMIKALSTTGNWTIHDNQIGFSPYTTLRANTSEIIGQTGSEDISSVQVDGFTLGTVETALNASGVTYLYMAVYDNDLGSGKSKYPRATDTSTLNLNAHVPFANGIDTTGNKVSIAYKNETITLSNSLVQGKNYIALLSDGSYVANPSSPNYGSYNGFGDYFDLNSQKWFDNIAIFNDTMTNTLNWTSTNGGTLSIENNRLKITNSTTDYGKSYKAIQTTIGKRYRFLYTIVNGTGSGNVRLGTTSGSADVLAATYSSGYSDFIASSTTTYISLALSLNTVGLTCFFDNIAIYPINADGSVDISNATALTPRNYLDCVVYADQNGQPEYVEQIEKVQYFDAVKANDYRGKNACTAWVNFDGKTTPPTIRDSYNVSAIIRTATGLYDLYFEKPMDNINYNGHCQNTDNFRGSGLLYEPTKTLSKCTLYTYNNSDVASNTNTSVTIFGGKN